MSRMNAARCITWSESSRSRSLSAGGLHQGAGRCPAAKRACDRRSGPARSATKIPAVDLNRPARSRRGCVRAFGFADTGKQSCSHIDGGRAPCRLAWRSPAVGGWRRSRLSSSRRCARAAQRVGEVRPPPTGAVDTEHMFGFTEGSDIGEKGETELMSETTGHFGKLGGSYAQVGSMLEAKHTLAENFRVSAAATAGLFRHDRRDRPGRSPEQGVPGSCRSARGIAFSTASIRRSG